MLLKILQTQTISARIGRCCDPVIKLEGKSVTLPYVYPKHPIIPWKSHQVIEQNFSTNLQGSQRAWYHVFSWFWQFWHDSWFWALFQLERHYFLLYQMLILKSDTVNLFASLIGNFLSPMIILTTNRLTFWLFHFQLYCFIINDTQRKKPQNRLTTRTFKNRILAACRYIIIYIIN